MAQQIINVGTAPNDGSGDAIRTSYIKCNENFSELYSRAQTSPPVTLIGVVGDQAGMYAYDENFWYYCFADYDASSIIWSQVAQIGNISVSGIQNGTSDLEFDNINGNLVVDIGGTANVAVFRSTGLATSFDITGVNINATNFYGAISTSSQPNITSVGTLSGLTLDGILTSTANITTTANVVGTTVSATGNLVATGNVLAENVVATTTIQTPGIVSATGNIVTDGYFVGTFLGNITGNFTIPGGNTQVIFNTSGNADASTNFTFNKVTNVLQVTGNVSTGNIISTTASVSGNVRGGNLLTGGLVSATGAIISGGNVSGGNIVSSGIVTAIGNIVSAANINGANLTASGSINASGAINASGNVTGGNVVGGSVSAVSNITGSNLSVTTATISGNASVGNISSSGLISITGNITAGNLNISGNIRDTGALTISTGSASNISLAPNNTDILVVTTSGANISGTASASGNVTGGNLITTGLVTTTGNVLGGNVVAVSAVNSSTVSASGNITGGNVVAVSAVNSSTVSASGNITGGNLSVGTGRITVNNIVNGGSNGVGNIGSSTTFFNTVFAKSTSAQYADLAEKYLADEDYAPGTVMVIGGSQEVTASNKDHDSAVVGVVSTNPAYVMNSGLNQANTVTVALVGRVPCQVQGPVRRGDLLVTAENGRARSEIMPRVGCVVGKALENFDGDRGVIEIIVGKL